jgi:hypothetical protein
MVEGKRLSVCDQLVLAAYRLEQAGTIPFTAEDLVVINHKYTNV